MKIMNSMLTAFSMYSRIPVPKVEWKEENRRYSLCFFPFIGIIIGAFFLLLSWLCDRFSVSTTLTAALLTALPVVITGGIHLDGFCDTMDAISSCQTKEKKLEILKDPRAGAFAVIWTAVYFLLYFGAVSSVKMWETSLIIAVGFVFSRALSGIAAVTFNNARKSGSLADFTEPAHKLTTVVTLLIFLTLSVFAMVWISPITGTVTAITGGLVFLYYRVMSYKQFGGITGDLAGYFLQISELCTLLTAVICPFAGGKI